MENIIVAVVSRDREYNKVLSAALTNACRELSVEIFDNREFVRLWSGYTGPGAFYNKFDLILWAGDEVCDSYSDNIIYLADKPSLTRKDFQSSRFSLYRYDSVRSLLSSMFEIYEHLTGRTPGVTGKSNTRLIGFASSSGGTGCTTLTMAVAQELTRFHRKKVLYLSLEDVESTSGFVEEGRDVRHVGEYLYRLLGRDCFRSDIPDAGTPFLESYLIKNAFGVEAFSPVRGKNPLRELTEEDMRKFLISLTSCDRYDVIAIDISTCLTESAMETMKTSDRICLAAGPASTEGREMNWLKHIMNCGGQEMLGKIVQVENMYNPKKDSTLQDGGRELGHGTAGAEAAGRSGIKIRKIRNGSASGSGILLEGDFGADIRKLTEMLMLKSAKFSAEY